MINYTITDFDERTGVDATIAKVFLIVIEGIVAFKRVSSLVGLMFIACGNSVIGSPYD